MEPPFSPRTIREYLPILSSVYASLEIDVQRHPALDDRDYLQTFLSEATFGNSKTNYAMGILNNWLQGTDFKVDNFRVIHKKEGARWADFIRIFDAKIVEHQNDVSIIALVMTKDGRVTRTLGEVFLQHDFEKGSQKQLLLQHLAESRNHDYVPTEILRNVIQAKTTQVTSKVVEEIRSNLASSLRLPLSRPIIESKRGSGYRIDSLYNVVPVD